MNARTSLFAAAILLLLSLGLTIYAHKQNESKLTWEYHVWNCNSWQEATGRLSLDGNEGWELVAVTETPTTYERSGGILRSGSVTIYLKRAK